MALGDRLRQGQGISGDGDWNASGARDQWRQGIGLNVCDLDGVSIGRLVYVIGSPHSYCTLTGFVGLWRADARFIIIENFLWSGRLLRREE